MNSPEFSNDGEVAIVTGGAKGIGLGIASALVRQGRRIVLFDLDRDALNEATTFLSRAGADVLGMPVDVTSSESVDQAVDAIEGDLGTPDTVGPEEL